ncbi:hypothetical protein BZF66_05890 [Salmonella enterica]|uniref:hypothetical protein n=1 Tax=Salmonella enterica TaxID=28901 RepID=UPI000FDF94D5|nr:hypothetical protein CPT_Munch_021 [Salmonella phage Munch]EAR2661063.1 hypothetical protein [Salmonella enterica]ECV9083957.1 hypothetical protein [Salmonella enterica subsp. enterica serovar Infantis]MCP0435946.1 hypothetical protein [Salmonella enterica subsp. enterica serovar Mbandaka]EAZ2022824.1 hypothetical protein [Salmonella enterica]
MIKEITTAPIEVQKAFEHVRSFFPDVNRVLYDEDCCWTYMDAFGAAPSFEGYDVDQAILEAGADAQYNIAVPVAYKA